MISLNNSKTGEAPRDDGEKGKSVGPGGDFNPEFRSEGGFGRGRDGYRREGGRGGGFGRGN